jgi:hypothetical protein
MVHILIVLGIVFAILALIVMALCFAIATAIVIEERAENLELGGESFLQAPGGGQEWRTIEDAYEFGEDGRPRIRKL